MLPVIQSHTSLRAIAALLVGYGHYTHVFAPDLFVGRTYLGVDFFFLLSGFILHRVYSPMFAAGVRRADWSRFMLRRLARIYPLHLAMLGVVLVILRFRIPAGDWAVFALNLGLVQGWGFTDRMLFNPPSWSISAEFAAYLLFPALVAISGAVWGRWAMGLGCLACYALLWRLGGGSLDLDAIGPQNALLRVAAAFPLGMLLARYSLAAPVGGGAWQAAAAVLTAAALWAGVPDILVLPPLALLMLSTVAPQGALSRGLSWRPLVRLGEMSYGLYLIQWPVMMLMFSLNPKLAQIMPESSQSVVSLALFLALLLGLSALSFYGVERPIMAWVRRRTAGPKLAVAPLV